MVERAGLMTGLSDVELRHRCRSAPADVRLAIDERRSAGGKPRLWPALQRRETWQSVAKRVRFWQLYLVSRGHRG